MTECVGVAPGGRHRKGKCDICGGCRVCKCECDGIRVEEKLKRKPGGQPGHFRVKKARHGAHSRRASSSVARGSISYQDAKSDDSDECESQTQLKNVIEKSGCQALRISKGCWVYRTERVGIFPLRMN